MESPLLIRIAASDSRPIYEQIMDEIRRAIALELIAVDAPLPSVRQLATELRINPNTVQQAYRELERDGTVYVRRGLGTFVAAQEAPGAERRTLARGVAERAVREAFRHGLTVDELVDAVRRVGEVAPDGAETEES